MDALAVVRHLHSLAEKPENRSTIVKVKGFFVIFYNQNIESFDLLDSVVCAKCAYNHTYNLPNGDN